MQQTVSEANELSCGDDNGVECVIPAQACAPGWTVCLEEPLLDAISSEDCHNIDGTFLCGFSHTAANGNPDNGCLLPDNQCNGVNDGSGWGNEAVCCGQSCRSPDCNSGVWPDATYIGNDEPCSLATSTVDNPVGVMCCKLSATVCGDAMPPFVITSGYILAFMSASPMEYEYEYVSNAAPQLSITFQMTEYEYNPSIANYTQAGTIVIVCFHLQRTRALTIPFVDGSGRPI